MIQATSGPINSKSDMEKALKTAVPISKIQQWTQFGTLTILIPDEIKSIPLTLFNVKSY